MNGLQLCRDKMKWKNKNDRMNFSNKSGDNKDIERN